MSSSGAASNARMVHFTVSLGFVKRRGLEEEGSAARVDLNLVPSRDDLGISNSGFC